MKKKYSIIFFGFLFLLLIVRVTTVQTNNTGINKLRDIVPKRIKARIFMIKNKLMDGKKMYLMVLETSPAIGVITY